MSKKIIIDLIEDYSTIETELVKLRDKGTEYLGIVTQLLQSSNAESIQPIETFLTAVKNIADNIFNKGFVKEKALIVDRITNSKEAFIVLNKSTQIDELIKNPDKKQLTTGEINRITEMLDELNVLFSSLIQKINCFLRFMTINKLDTYTQNDTTLNNALIQALKIKDKKKEVNAIELGINKNNEYIKEITAKTVTQSEVASSPVSFYSPRNIEEVQNENRGLIQEKEQLELSIDKIINRVVQLYDKKVEEERAAEADERAAEERGYDERATIAEKRAKEAEERGAAAEKRAKEAEERATIAEKRLKEANERGAEAEESAKAAEQKAQDCELKLSKQPSFQLGSLPPSPPASPPDSNYDSDTGSYTGSDTGSESSFTYTDADVLSKAAKKKAREYMEKKLKQLRINNPNLTPQEVRKHAEDIANSYKQLLKGGRRNRKTKRRQSRRRNRKTKRRQSRRSNRKIFKRRQSRRSNQKTKRRQGRRRNRKTKCRQSRRSNQKTFKRGGAPFHSGC